MTIVTALIALGCLALLFGVVLGYAGIRFKVESDPIVEQIDGRKSLLRAWMNRNKKSGAVRRH